MRAWMWTLGLLGCGDVDSMDAVAAPSPPPAECADDTLASDHVVARWQGGAMTYADLQAKLAGDLRNMDIEYRIERYEAQSQALDGLVTETLLDAEAKAQGLPDIDALLRREIEDKVTAPTAAEVDAYYLVVKRQLPPGATLEEARPYLQQDLLRRAQADRYRAYVAELKQKNGLVLDLPYPDLPRQDIPVAAHDPVLGKADAPITIVQFAEYQCYYCNQVSPTLEKLLADYDGRVRLVFKDFPLEGHARAVPAAVAAHCAGEQGKYWEMNRVLLGNQHALGDDDIRRYATDVGLDGRKFDQCLTSGRHEPSLQEDMTLAREVGVQATPSFFIDGVYLSGAQPYERFAAVIDRELAKKGAAGSRTDAGPARER